MEAYDYLIVGAGLFGAVFAQQMTEAGKRCLVIDRRPHIGGNIYSEKVEDIEVHRYGAHIFHTSDPEVWEYVQRFSEFLPFINSPIADYKGTIYNLPFNMNTFAKLWNIRTPKEAQDIIAAQQAEGGDKEPANLEEQAIRLVGRDVYEKLIRGYTQKQWGRPCDELPPDIIKRVPLRFTYDNNYFDDPYQGIPKDGYTNLIEAMLDGIEYRLSTDFFELKKEGALPADRIIYTGPIDAYFDYCYGTLDYRSLRFETKVLDLADYQGNAVVNYTDASVPYTRVIEHKHFAKDGQEKTVVTWEYPDTWTVEKEPYYPINDAKNQALYERYRSMAQKEPNVTFGGRLGSYRYLNMDQVVAEALAAAKEERNRIS